MTLITERLNAGKKLDGDCKKLLLRCLKKNEGFLLTVSTRLSLSKKGRMNRRRKEKRKDILDSRN